MLSDKSMDWRIFYIMKKLNNILCRIIHWIVVIFCKIFAKDYSIEIENTLMQFIKFGIVGLSNTIISYVLYAVSLLLFQRFAIFGTNAYLVSQVLAFVISVAWSFYWNNKYVFTQNEGETRSIWRALLKTYISYSFTGLFLNTLLLILWVQLLHISEFIAPVINLLVSVPLNFIINKFWAFRSKPTNEHVKTEDSHDK